MTQLWISLAIVVVLMVVIAVLIRRERALRRQLDEYRELLTRAAEGQNIHQDGDAERFKRSQYFARIGTWDWKSTRIDSIGPTRSSACSGSRSAK